MHKYSQSIYFVWYFALALCVFQCFWIIDQAYEYRKKQVEFASLQKKMHQLHNISKQLQLHYDYQLSTYHIEKIAKKQGLSSPKKVEVLTLTKEVEH